jgi:hypothetical protein
MRTESSPGTRVGTGHCPPTTRRPSRPCSPIPEQEPILNVSALVVCSMKYVYREDY